MTQTLRITILPNISKIFERCIFRQLSNFMNQFLSKYQCGFCKGYNTQYCLAAMLEEWKSAFDKGKSFGELVTDLYKAFDCLSLLAKLHAYEFSIVALRLIHSYLINRWQRKCVIQFLVTNCIWGTTRVYSRTFVVQQFSV